MNQTHTMPTSAHEVQALLRVLDLPSLNGDMMREVNAELGVAFRQALVDAANGMNREDNLIYLKLAVLACAPGTREAIRALGLPQPETRALIRLAVTEGKRFGTAFAVLRGSRAEGEDGHARATSYLTQVVGTICKPQREPLSAARNESNDTRGGQPMAAPQDNVHHLPRRAPAEASSSATAREPQRASGDGGRYLSVHLYGGKAALCFSLDETQKGNLPTVRIEAAASRGSKPEPPKIPSADQRGLSRARSMG